MKILLNVTAEMKSSVFYKVNASYIISVIKRTSKLRTGKYILALDSQNHHSNRDGTIITKLSKIHDTETARNCQIDMRFKRKIYLIYHWLEIIKRCTAYNSNWTLSTPWGTPATITYKWVGKRDVYARI